MSDGDGYLKKNEEWEQPIQSSFTMSKMSGKRRRALIRGKRYQKRDRRKMQWKEGKCDV